MRNLSPGDFAIPFESTDYLGNIIRLEDYRGKKVLVSFFRSASCPFCNLRIRELIKRHSEFKSKEIEIIAFFASPAEDIAKHAEGFEQNFPIIPDPTLATYKKYGIESSHLGMIRAMIQLGKMWRVMTSGYFNLKATTERPLIPADFLIGANLLIHRAYYGEDFGDHLPITEILLWGA